MKATTMKLPLYARIATKAAAYLLDRADHHLISLDAERAKGKALRAATLAR